MSIPASCAPGDIELVERLIRQSKAWALVDGLAASVAGSLIVRYPELGRTLDRWASDEDFWVRRSALLALLLPLRRGQGDFDRFSRYADAMLDGREFFIRKAIGWVLRETGRKQPDLSSTRGWSRGRAAPQASPYGRRSSTSPMSGERPSWPRIAPRPSKGGAPDTEASG